MRISDWSSDVCSSDLGVADVVHLVGLLGDGPVKQRFRGFQLGSAGDDGRCLHVPANALLRDDNVDRRAGLLRLGTAEGEGRSEEHTSELQSLMRISYAVFCLKKKN